MPQVILFLDEEHNNIVNAYAKENKLSKPEAILNMINQFEIKEEEEETS